MFTIDTFNPGSPLGEKSGLAPRIASRSPLCHARGENIESSAGRERFVLSKDRFEHLEQAKKRYGCSLYPLLLAPLYRTSGNGRVAIGSW